MFSLEMYIVVDISADKRDVQTNKNSRKSIFLPGVLAHGSEIFRVDAAFVAAHFPPRVVCGPNPTNGDISPKPRPLFEK